MSPPFSRLPVPFSVAVLAALAATAWAQAPGSPLPPGALLCLGPGRSAFRVAVAADGRTVATAGLGAARVWDIATGRQLREVPIPEATHWTNVGLSADGRRVAFPVRDPTGVEVAEVWDLTDGRRLCQVAQPEGAGSAMQVLSADGRHLATRPRGHPALRLCDAATGKEVRRVAEPVLARGQVLALGYQAHLAVLGDTTLVTFFQVIRSGRQAPRHEMEAYVADPRTGWSRSLVRCPDGSLVEASALSAGERSLAAAVKLAGAGFDETPGPKDGFVLALWETASGQRRWHVPSERAAGVAFAPDGRTLAAGGGAIRLYDTASGREIGRLEGQARALAFSPDGRRLVSWGDDGGLLWDVARWTCRPRATEGRLTAAELNALWADLAGEAPVAWRAVHALADAPGAAVPLLGERLKPAADPGAVLRPLLADLDSDSFEAREKAEQELRKIGDDAVGPLEKLLADPPSPEVKRRAEHLLQDPQTRPLSAEELRRCRALEALELIGDAGACRVLGELAKGAPEARLTRDARACLDRLARR